MAPLKSWLSSLFLLIAPAAATAAAATAAAAADNNGLATGSALIGEIQALQASLTRISELLELTDLPPDSEVMSRAAKLVRRVRSLVYAVDTDHQIMPKQDRVIARRQQELRERKQRRAEERKMQRQMLRPGGGIGSGEVESAEPENEVDFLEEKDRAMSEIEDPVTRGLWDTTITFPECQEKLLADCLEIITQQLIQLQLEAEFIIHEKRNSDQEGYNKVVIITDMTATKVKGMINTGIVEYPFMWDDSVLGYARMLGVDGQWDCHLLSPDECCTSILQTVPNPDTKGNYLQCHIFVPYGGMGNPKRDDRVFVKLSPDGRVHEPPFIS